MAADPPAKLSGAGLSLYANLLDPSGSSSKTAAAHQSVGESQQANEASASKQQISAASLRFQPTKRPQVSAPKSKPKAALQKSSHIPNATGDLVEGDRSDFRSSASHLVRGKNTLANWTKDADDDATADTYQAEKRQRGGRKNRKKNRDGSFVPQNWDDIYDPSRPNNYEEYKNSDEKHLGMRDWKVRLYEHRIRRRSSGETEMAEQPSQPNTSDPTRTPFISEQNNGGISNAVHLAHRGEASGDFGDDLINTNPSPYTEHQKVNVNSNEDRFAEENTPPNRPSGLSSERLPNAPPSVISKGPVLYDHSSAPPPRSEAQSEDVPPEDEAIDEATDENGRSLRPGQKGFAERLMSKYGWTKGTGLGASGSGIIDPLRVQLEKQKKKPDSEGGGFIRSGAGKIIGGKKGRSSVGTETGKFGQASEVIVLSGLAERMDSNDDHMGAGEGGLTQQIGDECSEKYGRVERVLIDRRNLDMTPVFLKFTNQMSALRAVNALDGSTFNNCTISARFYDLERFENGLLDLN